MTIEAVAEAEVEGEKKQTPGGKLTAQAGASRPGWVLWPAQVSFAVDADEMHETLYPYREHPKTYLLEAAYGLRSTYLQNKTLIERRELIFRLALVALGVETVLWALALALVLA
jgi:hypothetical protein